MIQEFLDRYGVEIAVERTDRNPMGPEAWQAHFDHYAVWFNTANGGMPITVSVRKLWPVPPTNILVAQIGLILHHANAAIGFIDWCDRLGFQITPDFEFYYEQVLRILPAFQDLLTLDGFEQLCQIGAEA